MCHIAVRSGAVLLQKLKAINFEYVEELPHLYDVISLFQGWSYDTE